MAKKIKPKPGARRAQLVAEARELFRRSFDHDEDSSGICLYMAACIIKVAHRRGLRLIPQAGSASWQIVPEHMDDGVSATHFSYVWTGDFTVPYVEAGLSLPEMHVWAADPARNEIVDLTAGLQPAQCKRTTGMSWHMPPPPDFVWHRGTKLPCGIYEPNMEATRYAVDMMANHVVPFLR